MKKNMNPKLLGMTYMINYYKLPRQKRPEKKALQNFNINLQKDIQKNNEKIYNTIWSDPKP